MTSAPATGGPRVRTLFLGSGDFAVPILRALAAAPETELVAVITSPPRPAGRSGALRPTPVALAGDALGIPVRTPAGLRDAAALAELAALAPGLLVLADYGRIVPQALLDLPVHGALNLHPSLLPRHRGATPIPAAILAGDAETGVTLMRMDAGIDTGPIVAAVRVPLDGTERAPALEAALAETAGHLLRAALPGWLAGSLPAVAQPVDGATLTRPLRREDAWLDPARGAAALARQVRAYDPWPGAWTEHAGARLIVHDAHAVPGSAPAGVSVAGGALVLATADGLLVLDAVQPAGKRRMPAADYVRGLRPPTDASGAGTADRG